MHLCFKNIKIVVRRFEFTELKAELMCKKEFPQVLCCMQGGYSVFKALVTMSVEAIMI